MAGRAPERLALALVVGSVVGSMAPAEAVRVPHTVVVSDDPAGFTPHVLSGRVNSIIRPAGLICVSARIKVTDVGTGSSVLLRLRTAANGPIVRTYLSGAGVPSIGPTHPARRLRPVSRSVQGGICLSSAARSGPERRGPSAGTA
jgi:hypothetical protein